MTLPRTLLGLAAAGCLAVQGCAALRRADPAPCNAVSVLEYADRIRGLPTAELEEENRTAQQAFAERGGVCDRFRLAAQLLLPDARVRDEARGVKLLNEYAEKSPAADGGLRSLARLLVATTRREWELDGRTRELSRKVAEERARADTLKRQLDELKDIERIMNERQKR